MYFCFWKVLSRAFRWRSEKTALRSMPRLGFPLGARGQEKVPGTGTTEEAAVNQRPFIENVFMRSSFSVHCMKYIRTTKSSTKYIVTIMKNEQMKTNVILNVFTLVE